MARPITDPLICDALDKLRWRLDSLMGSIRDIADDIEKLPPPRDWAGPDPHTRIAERLRKLAREWDHAG